MPFSIEMSPGKDAKGALAHTVTVTIDDHETVLTFFESKEDAEQFAQVERARLMGLMESGKSTASSTSARANRIGSRNPIAAGPGPASSPGSAKVIGLATSTAPRSGAVEP